ncbi:MAG: hypothetical protein AAF639_20970 [Chloroflexota bacterium]
MEYLKVKWRHFHTDEPIEIYSEINPDRWEIRKVELFADGSTSYASPLYHTGSTWLAETPIPKLDEINRDAQFEGALIDRHRFERIWLMSSEMILLHEPQLVKTIQDQVDQTSFNLNEFVVRAVEHYLNSQRELIRQV